MPTSNTTETNVFILARSDNCYQDMKQYSATFNDPQFLPIDSDHFHINSLVQSILQIAELTKETCRDASESGFLKKDNVEVRLLVQNECCPALISHGFLRSMRQNHQAAIKLNRTKCPGSEDRIFEIAADSAAMEKCLRDVLSKARAFNFVWSEKSGLTDKNGAPKVANYVSRSFYARGWG